MDFVRPFFFLVAPVDLGTGYTTNIYQSLAPHLLQAKSRMLSLEVLKLLHGPRYNPLPYDTASMGQLYVYLPTMTSTTIHKKSTRLMDRYSYTYTIVPAGFCVMGQKMAFLGWNFTSRRGPPWTAVKKKNIGGECPAFFDTSLRLCRDFKKSKHLKDGEMVTWYVNIMFTSNNSIFKIKIKKKLIYYQGFGAFRIWENLPNIAWTLPFSETTNGSGLLKIDGVQDAIMAGRIMFRQAPSSTCASKPGGLQYPTCLRYYRLRNRTPCKDKVCFSTGKGCHCPNRIRPQSQHSSVVCGVFCWPWPWWVFFSKHTDNTTTR